MVFVLLTGRHLARIVPEERPVIRIAEVAFLFFIINTTNEMFHFPLPRHNLLAITCLLLLLIAALVYWLRQRRERRQGEAE